MKMTRTQEAFVKDMTEHYLTSLLNDAGVSPESLLSEELIEWVALECGPSLFEHITFAELKRVDAFYQSEEFIKSQNAQSAFLEKLFSVVHADQAPQMLSAIMTEMLNPMDDPELFLQAVQLQEDKEIAQFESQGLEAQINMAVAKSKQLDITPEEEQTPVVEESPFKREALNPDSKLHAVIKDSLQQATKH